LTVDHHADDVTGTPCFCDFSIVPRNRTPEASKEGKRVKERKVESWRGSAIIINIDAGFVTSVNVG
jgi:hypothetical protein